MRVFWNDAPDHLIIGFVQSPPGIAELYSATFHSRAARDYRGRFIRNENRLQTAWFSIEDNPVAAELVPAVQTRPWRQHPGTRPADRLYSRRAKGWHSFWGVVPEEPQPTEQQCRLGTDVGHG